MNYPKVLYQHPDCAGKKWMPSNGTEGMIFMEAFCDRCIHEKWSHTHDENDKKCQILSNSMILGEVQEWVYSDNGWPVCKEWVPWDWSRDDDNNFNEPPVVDPVDPMQLNLFPLSPDETDFAEAQEKNHAGMER